MLIEREKMLAGRLYNCGDKELLAEWHRTKDLARDYSNIDSSNKEEKERILSLLLGGRGGDLQITAPFYVDYGNNIYFGSNCEVSMNYTFLDDDRIVTGNSALVVPSVQIYAAFHPTNAARRFGGPKEGGSFEFCRTQALPVVISDSVWTGGGATIMLGVTIGDHVVTGAGSVVTRDIPDSIIACGNSCRVIKENRQRTLMVRNGVHHKTICPGRTRNRFDASYTVKAGGNSVRSSIPNSVRSPIRDPA